VTEGPLVHPTAVVDDGAVIGEGARVWHFCHVMTGARVGDHVMLGQGCFVGRNVVIGARTRIQNHVSVFEGVSIEEDVFVGPGVVFTNVKNPRAGQRGSFQQTAVRAGATLGANSTVLPGVEIGRHAFVGAGALVREAVAPHALVVGVPARRVGWVSRAGARLEFENGRASCPATGEIYRESADGIVPDDADG
jgi:UDP-2-acetamido-3-amino-2,3-dideoxy-glucuronate N-acetyltransferase